MIFFSIFILLYIVVGVFGLMNAYISFD